MGGGKIKLRIRHTAPRPRQADFFEKTYIPHYLPPPVFPYPRTTEAVSRGRSGVHAEREAEIRLLLTDGYLNRKLNHGLVARHGPRLARVKVTRLAGDTIHFSFS